MNDNEKEKTERNIENEMFNMLFLEMVLLWVYETLIECILEICLQVLTVYEEDLAGEELL